MNRIRSRLAPLAALMALLLALAGCSAAPSTEEPGTASQTKYATGKYTQTEVTPAVDSGFAPAKLQMLDGVPTLSLYNDAQNTAAAFSWTGDGWETIDPSTVQAFLDGLDKTQVETLTACYGVPHAQKAGESQITAKRLQIICTLALYLQLEALLIGYFIAYFVIQVAGQA